MVKQVLIVEDSASQRELLKALLKAQGMKVKFAYDGLDAIEKVLTLKPDLIISDVVMPLINGYELCRRVKHNPQTSHIPFIFCSIKATEPDRHWGLKQGADAYIGKPFSPEELLDTINLLDGSLHK